MTIWYIKPTEDYVECECCDGRGGLGTSSGGVTTSYRQCPECLGEGVVELQDEQ